MPGANTKRRKSSRYSETNPIAELASVSDVFALDNLLPAGAIPVPTSKSLDLPQLLAAQPSTTDGWNSLPCLTQLHNAMTEHLLRALVFLVEHYYVRATCCTTPALDRFLFVRIYLIPHDLKNARGLLRNRNVAALAQAQGYLKVLLAEVRQEESCWNAVATTFNMKNPKMLMHREVDNRSMAEVYSELPSPCLSTHNATAALSSIWGFQSTLYNYQRQSVAMMIEKESSHQILADPLYVKLPSMRGHDIFLQPTTMEVLRERPTIAPVRGGILCEELGTGKTVMVLALILATIEERPDPEDCDLYERPVMSPLAYRTFRSPDYTTSRCRLQGSSPGEDAAPVPSLVDILVHHLRALPFAPGVREYEEELDARNLWQPLQKNIPYYHIYREAPSPRSRSRNVASRPRLVYLSSATLVIVPISLIDQWDREVHKHCTTDVKRIILRVKDPMPSAQELASQYDLIVMSDACFRREAARNKIESLFDSKPCACPFIPDSRVPDCRCPGHPAVSALLQVRWKRLVIDEGHILGNIESTINEFVRLMSIERKWIVTGTPTSNTLGLSLGRSNTEDLTGVDVSGSAGAGEGEDPDEPSDTDDDSQDAVDFLVDLSSAAQPTTDGAEADGDADSASAPRRIWTADDRRSLHKLSVMIARFLGVPRFKSDAKLFTRCVSSPLCRRAGPGPFAVQVLSQAMQMAMVRHRIEDVEMEVGLPPMTRIHVYMDLDAYARMSYNAMLAAVAVNAVDSQRTDIDYLFHPRRLKELNTAVANMSQGLFWSASDILYNVDQISADADEFLDRAIKRGVSDADIELLEQAIYHARTAANDQIWRAMQVHEDVPFRVSHLDPMVFTAWNRGQLGTAHGADKLQLMHANRLVQLRELVRGRPLITQSALVQEGIDVRELEAARCQQKSERLNKKMVNEVVEDMTLRQRVNEEEEGIVESGVSSSEATVSSSSVPKLSPLLASSPMRQTHVGASLSTKLNYILKEVLEYHRDEKFLIFSSSPLTLAHVAEGLSLIEVKFLRYTTEIPQEKRDHFVMTFETSDTFRVFLMDLKHAARGLNLVSASRIIFCEPVWEPDVESQAIKRAHRMGQTKPIIVKTLAIRSTAEEKMIDRRQDLGGATSKFPPLTSDAGMRRFLESPTFLTQSSEEQHTLDLPFLGDFDSMPSIEPQNDISRDATDVEETLSDDQPFDDTVVDQPAMNDKPRKGGVRFAEDVGISTNGSAPPAKPPGTIVRFANHVDVLVPAAKRKEAPEQHEQGSVKFVAGFNHAQVEANKARKDKPWKVKGVRFA